MVQNTPPEPLVELACEMETMQELDPVKVYKSPTKRHGLFLDGVYVTLLLLSLSSFMAAVVCLALNLYGAFDGQNHVLQTAFYATTIGGLYSLLLAHFTWIWITKRDIHKLELKLLEIGFPLTHQNLLMHENMWPPRISSRFNDIHRETTLGYSLQSIDATHPRGAEDSQDNVLQHAEQASQVSRGTVRITRRTDSVESFPSYHESLAQQQTDEIQTAGSIGSDNLIESTRWSPKSPKRAVTWPPAYLPGGVNPFATPEKPTPSPIDPFGGLTAGPSRVGPLTPPRIDTQFWTALGQVGSLFPELASHRQSSVIGNRDSLEIHRKRTSQGQLETDKSEREASSETITIKHVPEEPLPV